MRRKESPDLMMVTLETRDFYPKINGKESSSLSPNYMANPFFSLKQDKDAV